MGAVKRNTLSVLFIIKKAKLLKNGEAPICMRITVNKRVAEVMIKQSIPVDLWNQKKKSLNKGGRKPKLAPRTHRYSLNLDDVENAKFLAFYDQSGYKVKTHFIKNCIFGKSFNVLRIDKSKVDYYIQLSQLFSQFRSIGILYNQMVKELHSNFAEKKALALLYKLERYTVELVKTNQQIIALTKQFEASYKEEGIISAGK